MTKNILQYLILDPTLRLAKRQESKLRKKDTKIAKNVDKMASIKQALFQPCWEFTNHSVPQLLIFKVLTETLNLSAHNNSNHYSLRLQQHNFVLAT